MAGLLSIGISGLAASQAHLSTVGHNITNADTPGFSRQQVTQQSSGGQYIGPAGFIGSGTTLNDVRRMYSGFIDTQLQSATALNGDTKSYLDSINQINSLLADSGTGVNVVLKGFFDSVQNVVSKPTDLASRQLLMTSAESLSNRFGSVQTQMEDQGAYVNSQLKTMTDTVNGLADKVAKLNVAIKTASLNGTKPNDLMDSRDQAVRELSGLVGVKVVDQDGQFALFLGSGQPLVIGNQANTLTAEPSKDDPSRLAMIFTTPTTRIDITDVVTGGTVGGLLRYRSEVLDPAMNELGRLSLVIADQVNQQLGQGLDLNGEFGATLFGDINAANVVNQRSIAQGGNSAGSGNFEVRITDTSQLSKYDYEVEFTSATEFTVRRSDGTDMGAFDLATDPEPELADGFSLSFAGGAPAAGDTFTLIPTRHAAGDISVALTEPKRLGLAAPLSATTGSGNYGTGSISQPELKTHLDIYAPAADQQAQQDAIKAAMPVRVVFGEVDAATGMQDYKLYDVNGAEVTAAAGTYIPGQSKELPLAVTVAGITVEFSATVSGSPANNDSFTISFNRDGQSDNRNALKLQDLQSKATVDVDAAGKGSSFTTAYGSLISEVGAKTAQAQADNGATEAILTQATATRESLSGVNLDEEATNLIKFQQYYTASSQIIKAAQETFNTLLSAL